jgi:hypothetical protein
VSVAATEGTEGEVRQLLHDFLYSIAVGDLEALERLWCSDATMHFAFGEPQGLIVGRPAVVERFRRMFTELAARQPNPPYVRFKTEDFAAVVLDAGHAAVYATLAFDGRVGRRTLICRREPAGFRILHLHASNIGGARGPESA